MPPAPTKSNNAIFSTKVSQGQKVIDFGILWNGIYSEGRMPNIAY